MSDLVFAVCSEPLPPIDSASKYEGESKEAYKTAKENENLLAHLNCHCGCMKSEDHKSLHTCFETKHGDHCKMCRAIVFRGVELKKEGKPVDDISKIIDEEFKRQKH